VLAAMSMSRLHPLVTTRRAVTRGVTLVELMVGVAILGVILAMAAPSMSDFLERRRVIAAAGELSNLMMYAKSEVNAVGTTNGKLNLHMEPDPSGRVSCASLSVRTNFDSCTCYEHATNNCATGSVSPLLRQFFLPRGAGQVYFDASADVWMADTYVVTFGRNTFFSDIKGVAITVVGPRSGARLRVEYNDAGRVRTCSPNGSMSGYPSC